MVNTSDFQTKTYFIDRMNPVDKGTWQVAMDIGYSSVKAFSPSRTYSFPSYIREVAGEYIGNVTENNILYRDENGKEYIIGEDAYKLAKKGDSIESVTRYQEDWYASQLYLILCRATMAIGMDGMNDTDIIHLTTGLPPSYLKEHKDGLIDLLSQPHKFSLKVGLNDWIPYDFTVDRNNITVFSQPAGTLFSLMFDNNGRPVKGSEQLRNSTTLILDGGFGTLDFFDMGEGYTTNKCVSHNDLGMRRIFDETIEKMKESGVYVTQEVFQKSLGKGKVTYYNKVKDEDITCDYSDILEDSITEICNNTIKVIKNDYDNLVEYDNLVITGGTGGVWTKQLEKAFERRVENDGLNIFVANKNDVNLPIIFSNVRGYYMMSYAFVHKELKKK